MNGLISTLNHSFLGALFSFGLGLIWGSFFNVCIARIPERKSFIPRSRCPHCSYPIPFYLNVPVLSFVLLMGKCRNCKRGISIQYPLVELGTAILFLFLFWVFGFGWEWLGFAVFSSILVIISVIDLYHQIIPDELSLPGILLGFLFALFVERMVWWESALGILAGGGVFLAIAYLYEKIAGREGLGGGDIKLLAMIGAWLGIKSILIVIIVSCSLGSVAGLLIMWIQKRDLKYAIPFGPFLAMGALIYLFWGTEINGLVFPEIP